MAMYHVLNVSLLFSIAAVAFFLIYLFFWWIAKMKEYRAKVNAFSWGGYVLLLTGLAFLDTAAPLWIHLLMLVIFGFLIALILSFFQRGEKVDMSFLDTL